MARECLNTRFLGSFAMLDAGYSKKLKKYDVDTLRSGTVSNFAIAVVVGSISLACK